MGKDRGTKKSKNNKRKNKDNTWKRAERSRAKRAGKPSEAEVGKKINQEAKQTPPP